MGHGINLRRLASNRAGGSDEAKERFQRINHAYEKISKNVPDDDDEYTYGHEDAMAEMQAMFEGA